MNVLTEVELYRLEGRIERWIRFGNPIDERILNRRQRVLAFARGSVFAFVRWASNDYGTLVSRLDILRAAGPGEACSTIPFVDPGGEVLLRAFGWPKVEAVLEHIDAIEALGVDPVAVDPNHWRHAHNRFAAGEQPRAYTLERHRAWTMRRKVEA